MTENEAKKKWCPMVRYSAGGADPPLLFETMIFGLGDDSYQTRCSTWKQAVQQHAEAVDYAFKLIKDSVQVVSEWLKLKEK